MGKNATPLKSGENRKLKPAESPEAREDQCIALAYNLVEQRLRDGSATSQETTHFLKMGSYRHRLELEKLKKENELLVEKTKAIQSSERQEELYSQVLSAIKTYSGIKEEEDEEDIF